MTNHTETQEGYGVLVTRKDGTRFVSLGENGRFFRNSRGEAKLWKRELAPHLRGKCKVVRIRATWEVIQ